MEKHTTDVINQCATGSHEGTLRFPDVVKKLLEAGVEQYHADFVRGETTYYLRNGESLVVALPVPAEAISANFDGSEVAAAVRDSQQGKLSYKSFIPRVMKAGCAGYFVYLDGQRVIYLGRLGEMHIEYFPALPAVPQSMIIDPLAPFQKSPATKVAANG